MKKQVVRCRQKRLEIGIEVGGVGLNPFSTHFLKFVYGPVHGPSDELLSLERYVSVVLGQVPVEARIFLNFEFG